MLGSAADAEDVVQETWLRWAAVDQPVVQDPRAYLVRSVTRQSLNRLRTLSRRREEYVGEWLPEPLLTSPDVAEDVELAEGVSIAMLTVLETLTPTERAVFVLREVFEVPYDEIAAAVNKSQAAVRQLAHRAREHVAARRPRMQVDRTEQRQASDGAAHFRYAYRRRPVARGGRAGHQSRYLAEPEGGPVAFRGLRQAVDRGQPTARPAVQRDVPPKPPASPGPSRGRPTHRLVSTVDREATRRSGRPTASCAPC
jgi:RNA polymerase sigma factor (sigma-70 family)